MKAKTKKIFTTLIYIIIFIYVQLPLFFAGGERYNIYGLYSYAEKQGPAFVFQIQMILIIAYQVIGVAYLLTVFLNKDWHLNMVGIILGFAIMVSTMEGMGVTAENSAGMMYPFALIALSAIEFLVPKMADAKREAEEEAKESVERDRQNKEEKKRRLRFEGSYPELFYQMVWKNFRYYWRDYVLFILCGVMVSTLSFVGLGSYEMMAKIHGSQSYVMGAGLGKILLNALLPIGICAIVLMVYVLLFYLKKRILSYSMFLVLGSRKKTLYIMMAIEIVFSLLCALILGCLLGNGILVLLRGGISGFLGAEVALSPVTWATYLKMFGVTALVYLISLMGFRDIARDLNIISASARRVQKEKLPQKRVISLTIAGALLVLWSIFSYLQLRNYEDIKILGVHFIGIFLIIRYGMAAYLRKAEKGEVYLQKLMYRNHLYQKSKTTTWYILALSLVSTCAVFYFSFQAVSVTMVEDMDTLFPYDFMCIVDDEDNRFFQDLQEKYDLEIAEYPMVRVSSSDGRPEMEAPHEHSPQGQHIGISETTYHALKKALDADYQSRALGLDDDGKTIYISHQQDRSVRAQPTDWQFNRSKPRLHVGLPCEYYRKNESARGTGYPIHKIAGEKIESVTGCFRQGLQENLIVFSDEYFKKAQGMWEYTDIRYGKKLIEEPILNWNIRQGPTKLVLLKAQEADLNVLEKEMQTLAQMPNHIYEAQYSGEVSSYYSKKSAIYDLKTEHMMRLIVNGSIIATLLIAFTFLMCVKVLSEMDDKIRRAAFLKTMGMHKKERIRMLRKELSLFFWVPAIVTAASTCYFTAATFHVRMYSGFVMRDYLERAVWIWGLCFLIEGLVIGILSAFVIHRVEGKDE